MKTLCLFEDVRIVRKGVPLISACNWAFSEGRIICILGANGSGKTTLLKCLVGLIQPSWGQIKRSFSGVGYLGHDSMLYKEMTVRENLKFFAGLAQVEWSDCQRRIEEWNLTCHLDKYVFELSQGLRSKVAMCRAFFCAKELLVLDEPSAALDDQSTDILKLAVRKFVKSGKGAVVIATHDVARLLDVADSAVVMNQGAIVMEGSLPKDRELIVSGYSTLNR